MAPDTSAFKHASALEGLRFTAQIAAPNVLLGLFNKRELPSRIASTVGADYLGYRLAADGVHVEPDDAEQTALARIGHLRRARYSLRRIAATLNEQGLRTRRGSPWRL